MNISKIENYIIKYIDKNLGYYRYFRGKKNIGSLERFSDVKTIFFLMAPAFGNVGDEAIVEATCLFLHDKYPEYNLTVIEFQRTYQMLKEIRRIIKPEDIIVLQGGGNIGTLYYDAEKMREFIIKKFPNNTIISMPQSIYFSASKKGKKKLSKSKAIYNSHKHLTLIAREKYSYEKMAQEYDHCSVLLNPDIVFYYSKNIKVVHAVERYGIMTCLRTDKEDVLGEKRTKLIQWLVEKYSNIIISDTCVPRDIPSSLRESEVLSLIYQFMRVKLVITDRLHGMVLAALTNTPCIVLPSVDNKVLGTYEWIKEINYIVFLNPKNFDDIFTIVDRLLGQRVEDFDWESFRTHYFDDLRERIGV